MTSILQDRDCYLTDPQWDEIGLRCSRVFDMQDPLAFQILRSLAELPELLREMRNAADDGIQTSEWRQSALAFRAQLFKTNVAKHAQQMQSHLEDPSYVTKQGSKDPGSACYIFRDPAVCFRFNMYWVSVIAANVILARLEAGNATLIAESLDAATNICMSTQYMQSFKPLGILWTTTPLAMAYGVSSLARQSWILSTVRDLFSEMPMAVGHKSLQYIFHFLTGGRMARYMEEDPNGSTEGAFFKSNNCGKDVIDPRLHGESLWATHTPNEGHFC